MFKQRFLFDFFKHQAQTHSNLVKFTPMKAAPLEISKRFYSHKKDVILPETWKNETKLVDIIKGYYTD
jgi:hypothetical protein